MNLLPFAQLPPFRKRLFVPTGTDLAQWDQISPLLDELERQADSASSAPQLELWLVRWSELASALDEESTRRYIAMTCHTDNADAEAAYLHYVEQIEPRLKPRQFALAQRFVQHPQRRHLPRPRYQVLDRDLQLQVELFRPENVALETEEARLCQQYQKLSGALTVQFQGQEQTLIQMGRYLEEPDRAVRREAWELVANRRLQEADRFNDILDTLLNLRQKIARNAGFSNYRDYAFRKLGRFDYTPADCESFHAAVETAVMPALRQLHAQRKAQLKVDRVQPWDLAVDPLGRARLRPFERVEDLLARTRAIFQQVDPELAAEFQRMEELHLLDLANRKGKAPGGYQSNLSEARLPFIFMNAVGLQRDVETLLHEAGHAFHAVATQNEDLHAYRNPPIEFCEVASMSMELLGNEFLEQFYSPAEAARARQTHLETILGLLPWIATVDAFQHWLYTHPDHSREQRTAAWLQLMNRFGGAVDWTGCEAARGQLWHRQLHIFLHPFYYIEYGIAQLGALQVWANWKRDPARSLQPYRKGLGLGGSRPLPELFGATGIRFDFSQSTIVPLVQLVQDQLNSSVKNA